MFEYIWLKSECWCHNNDTRSRAGYGMFRPHSISFVQSELSNENQQMNRISGSKHLNSPVRSIELLFSRRYFTSHPINTSSFHTM